MTEPQLREAVDDTQAQADAAGAIAKRSWTRPPRFPACFCLRAPQGDGRARYARCATGPGLRRNARLMRGPVSARVLGTP